MVKIKEQLRKYQMLLWILFFFLVWECASRFGLVNDYILPPFSKVAVRAFREVTQSGLGRQIVNSLVVVIEGFVLSFVIAIIIFVLSIYSKIFKSLFLSLCTLMNPLPGIALLPLIMMWFGIGNGAMLALIIHGVLWPLVTNLMTGYETVPKIYKEWGLNIGLKPIRMFLDIYFFSLMPYIVSGLRVGWGRAWRALISAEMVFGMIGSLGGIGYYIYVNRAYANTTNVMAGILMIVFIGVFVEKFLFGVIEKNTIGKWGEL